MAKVKENENLAEESQKAKKRMDDPFKHLPTIPIAQYLTVTPQKAANSSRNFKKYTRAAFEYCMSLVEKMDGVEIKKADDDDGVNWLSFAIKEKSAKLKVRYSVGSQSLQMQGKTSEFFLNLVKLFESNRGYENADAQKSESEKPVEKGEQESKNAQPKSKKKPQKKQQTKQTEQKKADSGQKKTDTEQKKADTEQKKSVNEPQPSNDTQSTEQKSKGNENQPKPSQSKRGQRNSEAERLKSIADEERRLENKRKQENEQRKRVRDRALEGLKKRIPSAVDFMPEQAVTDLCMAYADIIISRVTLADYSALLMPPYRALEKFIFTLQISKDINVKMIGQAYDKKDGEHILKSVYTKKIGSVVFSEVMASLYIEYFNRRNYYSHSDYSDQNPRHIFDRAEIQRIFNGLLDIIEYNGKKLCEIGFKLPQEVTQS